MRKGILLIYQRFHATYWTNWGRENQKLKGFYRKIHNNQDGLLDLEKRGIDLPAYLGVIEGDVD